MDETIDYQKEIDSLSEMIKGPVDRRALEEELDRYLNKYLMDLESSKRAIIKDHGGTDDDYVPPTAERCRVSDIREGLTCSLVARVSGFRHVRTRNNKNILKISAYDDTGSILIIVWDADSGVDRGAIYTFRNCHIKNDDYEKRMTATCDLSNIIRNDDARIKPLFEMLKASSISECDVKEGLSDATVCGRIERIWAPSSNPRAPKASGLFRIGSSTYNFVTWADLPLREGRTVCIDGVSVSKDAFRGGLQLRFSDHSSVYEVD